MEKRLAEQAQVRELTLADIEVADDGSFIAHNYREAMALAREFRRAGLVKIGADESYQTETQVGIAILEGKKHQLEPLTAVRSICVINNVPCWYGDGLVGLILRSGLCCHLRTYFRGEDGAEIGRSQAALLLDENGTSNITAGVEIKRKDYAQAVQFEFSAKDAIQARLWWGANKRSADRSPWQRYPLDMLVRRAFGRAVDYLFADVLGAFTNADKLFDIEVAEAPQIVRPERRKVPAEVVEPSAQAPAAPAAPAAPVEVISREQQKRLFALAREKGCDHDTLRVWLADTYGLASTGDIPRDMYDEICTSIPQPEPNGPPSSERKSR